MKNTYLRIALAAFASISFITGCTSSKPETNDIFMCGIQTGNDNLNRAFYRINETHYDLNGNNRYSYANDIQVVGNDIYVAGCICPIGSEKTIAVYWKNGKIVYLTDGKYNASAKKILVVNDDIYCIGYEADGPLRKKYRSIASFNYDMVRYDIAKCWKNGTLLYKLTKGNDGDASAEDIAIDRQGNLHIIGYDKNQYIRHTWFTVHDCVARYWINGKQSELYDSWGAASAISIDQNNSIYIGGWIDRDRDSDGTEAVYWENGWMKNLSNNYNSDIQAIYSTGTDCYLAGYTSGIRNNTQAAFWKNGECIPLTEEETSKDSMVKDIQVLNGDIYCSGYNTGNIAGYWKNGEFVAIDEIQGSLNGIAIRPKEANSTM